MRKDKHLLPQFYQPQSTFHRAAQSLLPETRENAGMTPNKGESPSCGTSHKSVTSQGCTEGKLKATQDSQIPNTSI